MMERGVFLLGYSDVKEMLKDARNFATGANDIQTVNLLKDIQIEVYDLLEENRELRDKIRELENNDITESEMKYIGNVYFFKKDGPFCTKCFDDEKKKIRMSVENTWGSSFITAKCPKCANEVITSIKKNTENERPWEALERYINSMD